jgi:hypothetical protein
MEPKFIVVVGSDKAAEVGVVGGERTGNCWPERGSGVLRMKGMCGL